MKLKIIGKLKSEKGASLPFVLIIGMVIMILVASLLAAANSDFTFTQQSLESRQAYIDAKSVIEFGKIEINSRMTALKNKNEEIKNATDAATLTTLISQRATLITTLDDPFTIYGAKDSVTDNLDITTLSLSPASGDALGVCTVALTGAGTDTTQYAFDIKTQNLKRKLDYKVDFAYKVTTATTATTNNWKGSSYVPDTKPINTDGTDWTKVTTLQNQNLTSKTNICVTAAAQTYYATQYLSASSDIVFQGNLVIKKNTTLYIQCNQLWVTGSITLEEGSTLIVTGNGNNNKKQMIVDGLIKSDTNNLNHSEDINISNLDYFESKGLNLYGSNGSDFFKLDSKTIKINGDVSLNNIEGYNYNNGVSTTEITTQYFDCSGKTSIENSGSSSIPFVFASIDGILNIRFVGGYDQQDSHVDINDANLVIFGSSFYLKSSNKQYDSYRDYTNWWSSYWDYFYWDHLYVEANNIYLEGTSIRMTWKSLLFVRNNNDTNVFTQSKISYLDNSTDNLGPGSYTGKRFVWNISGTAWEFGRIISSDLNRTGDYPANTSIGTVTLGLETYY
ncbi:hypothetical protein [Acetobacterium tundrae]|uniref:Flp pilus-assembly TadG-like N-terminal domain-containing protein n=1 Tax=Acetobacterium tundrae TaxID=132932 RepID=A0ABR6WKL3_9FIRM|nr:hypothetical protein [Acetobacterium tundrae]MBC3796776.1 hypothetical protein [Acetobacterium tundrae]